MKVSITELSGLTGRDRRFIRSRVAGLPSEAGPKGAILVESSQALAAIYQTDRLDPGLERARLDRARADLAELALAQKRGELLAASDVEENWTSMVLNARSKLLALPSKLAHELAGTRDPAEVASRLKTAVYQALEELASRG
ncbi:hypothetical protein [Thiohalocapsa marina]|uniref:hypothetical protein n=1 Tax=Thiohalocapsa marina TaxID=424902 RepID=UPI0036DE8ECA